jgi:DNA-binding CsgD family transcriptional regulator
LYKRIMTRLVFLPDDNTSLEIDLPQAPDTLAAIINAGHWIPPPDLGYDRKRILPALRALRQGQRVIVLPAILLEKDGRTRPYFTPRQLEVLEGLAQGLTTKQMARRLGVRPRTIAAHVDVLKLRLGAVNRAETVSRAAALGLVAAKAQKR